MNVLEEARSSTSLYPVEKKNSDDAWRPHAELLGCLSESHLAPCCIGSPCTTGGQGLEGTECDSI